MSLNRLEFTTEGGWSSGHGFTSKGLGGGGLDSNPTMGSNW